MPNPDKQQAIAMRRIDRAVHELRGGYVVLLQNAAGDAWLAASAETMALEDWQAWLEPMNAEGALVVTGIRAERLGFAVDAEQPAYAIALAALADDQQALASFIDPLVTKGDIQGTSPQLHVADDTQIAALSLAKLAALLPAMLVAKIENADVATWAKQEHVLSVSLDDIAGYKQVQLATLTQVSAAHVPLKLAEDTRVLAFRPRYGSVEHLAVCVGQPEQQEAPLVRVHSSCVTGDILGSLRCDCGEQLQEALARMAKEGHGVLLYMIQEGRGIGIANKLRAYRLQDGGLDTLDANEEIGFAADERQFDTAAEMLKQLGISRVRLLSNNPDKVQQLKQCGIAVVGRETLSLPANAHNQRYLDTKEKRSGHIF